MVRPFLARSHLPVAPAGSRRDEEACAIAEIISATRTAAYPVCNASRLLWSGREAWVRWPLRGLDGTMSLSPISWLNQDLGIVARFVLCTLPRYAVLQL